MHTMHTLSCFIVVRYRWILPTFFRVSSLTLGQSPVNLRRRTQLGKRQDSGYNYDYVESKTKYDYTRILWGLLSKRAEPVLWTAGVFIQEVNKPHGALAGMCALCELFIVYKHDLHNIVICHYISYLPVPCTSAISWCLCEIIPWIPVAAFTNMV